MRATRTVGRAVVALGVTALLCACASAGRTAGSGHPDAAASAHAFSSRALPTAGATLTGTLAAPTPPAPEPPAPPAATTRTVDGTASPPTQTFAIDASALEQLETGPYVIPRVGESAVDRQMNYLFAHWNNYNTSRYGDFNAWGGDCQNFVSQSLVARGWTMTPEWYNDWPHNSWSAAWVHVPSFNSWMNRHPYGAMPVQFNNRSAIKVGDLVVFDWENDGSLDHIQVVSRVTVVNGEIKIAMIGHNTDSDFRDLDTTINVTYPNSVGWFWSIPYP